MLGERGTFSRNSWLPQAVNNFNCSNLNKKIWIKLVKETYSRSDLSSTGTSIAESINLEATISALIALFVIISRRIGRQNGSVHVERKSNEAVIRKHPLAISKKS